MTNAELSRVYAAVRAARRNLDGTADLFYQRHTPSVIKALLEAEVILENQLLLSIDKSPGPDPVQN